MKRVWEVYRLAPDVERGELRYEDLGIELSHVLDALGGRREGVPKYYLDPAEFLSRTYPTEAVRGLLRKVVGRVLGQGEEGTYILRSGFGGGKTHALLAVYHLFRLGDVGEVDWVVRDVLGGAREVPRARVVAIDCNALSIRSSPRTLWGELGRQLGAWDLVRDLDAEYRSPMKRDIEEIIGRGGPNVILIDELGELLRSIEGERNGDERRRMYSQVVAFFRQLTAALGPRDALIVAFPEEASRAPSKPPYDEEVLAQLDQVAMVLGRKNVGMVPVEKDEVPKVLRRRLLGNPEAGDDQAREIAREFNKYYRDRVSKFPSKVIEPNYQNRLIDYYPVHPELMDVLYDRVSTIPEFQRTRGALALMARTFRRIWSEKPEDAYYVMPKHVPLADPEVKELLTDRLGRGALRIVVESDIENPRGGGRAQGLGREQLAVARAIFLYSLMGREDIRNVAPTQQEVALSYATPDVHESDVVANYLKDLTDNLWYIYGDERGRYWFSVEPNLNKAVADQASAVTPEEAEAIVRDALNRMCRALQGRIGIMGCAVWEDPADDNKLMIHIMRRNADPHEAFRAMKHRNTKVFIVPGEQLNDAIDKARYVKACEILKGREEFRGHLKEIEEKLNKYQREMVISLIKAYSEVYYPSGDGLSSFYLEVVPKDSQKDWGLLAEDLENKLRERGKLVSEIPGDYLWDQFLKRRLESGGEMELRKMLEEMLIDTSLPFIGEQNQDILGKPLEQLVNDGRIAVMTTKGTYVIGRGLLGEDANVIDEARSLARSNAELERALREFEDKYSFEFKLAEASRIILAERIKQDAYGYASRLKDLLERARPREPEPKPAATVKGPTLELLGSVEELERATGARMVGFSLEGSDIKLVRSAFLQLKSVLGLSGGSAEGRVLVRSEDGSLEGEMRFRSRIEEFQRPLNDAMEALDALLRGRKCSVSVSAEARDVSLKLDRDNIRFVERILGPGSQGGDLKWQISVKREA
jgi:hypothetical protein